MSNEPWYCLVLEIQRRYKNNIQNIVNHTHWVCKLLESVPDSVKAVSHVTWLCLKCLHAAEKGERVGVHV